MDWTDFDADDQSTLALNLVTPSWPGDAVDMADRLEGRKRCSQAACCPALVLT